MIYINKKVLFITVSLFIALFISSIFYSGKGWFNNPSNEDKSTYVSETPEITHEKTVTITETPAITKEKPKKVTETPEITVTQTPEATVTQDLPPKETSIPESTKNKDIPEAPVNTRSFSEYVDAYISPTVEKKEIELEVGEPILEIKSESDLFQPWGEIYGSEGYSLTVRIDDGNKTIWGFGHGKSIDTSAEIIRYENEGFNINGINKVLKEKGINIADCDIKFISDINYDEDDLVFEIYDSNKENLFLLKENLLISLSDYGIAHYYKLVHSHNVIYSVIENNTNYISLYDEKDNTIENYIIPFELKSIECAYFSGKNEVSIVTKKNSEENQSYFRINTEEKTIVEFETVKNLTDLYPLQFSFKSDVVHNTIEEEIGDIYIIESSDDGYSGHHFHDYLYGVNKETGQRIWSFYGDYYRPQYYISEDEKYITIFNLVQGYVKCLEIQTGKVIREKDFLEGGIIDEVDEYENVYVVFINEQIVAISKDNFENIWEIGVPQSSSNRLIYKFSEDERHIYYFDENDFKAKCLEISTGKIIWEKEIDSSSHLEAPYKNYFLTNELFVIFSEKRIIAFNTIDGSIAWQNKLGKEAGFQYKVESFYRISVSIHNDVFVLKYSDGLIAIDAENGGFLWDTPITEVNNYYKFYKTSFSDMEILVLLEEDNIYAIDTKTGDIINEFHEKRIYSTDYAKVELKDNILYLHSRYLDIDDKSINLETREIKYIPITISEDLYFLKELLTGKNYYDGIGILKGYDTNIGKAYIKGGDLNGYVKWVFNYKGYDSIFFNYDHSLIRVKNKVYIDYRCAIVCVDAQTGKGIFQLGIYDSYDSKIVELSDGTYWVLGYNEYVDVYKID